MRNYKFYILLPLALLVLSMSSCLKDNDVAPIPLAGFSMINAYPDAEAVVYFADQNAIRHPNSPSLLYRHQHPVIEKLFTGNRKISVIDVNRPDETLIDTTFTAKDSTFYSAFLYGIEDQVKQIITTDKAVDNINQDESAIRFFNLATGAGAVSVEIDGEAIPAFGDRTIETGTSAEDNQQFMVYKSGTFTITVKDENNNVLISRESVDLNPRTYHSLILVGIKGDSESPLYIGKTEHAAN